MKKYLFAIIILLSLFSFAFADEYTWKNFKWNDEYESGNTRFMGFETAKGAWYIQAIDTTTGHRVTYAYESGVTYYDTAWAWILEHGSGVSSVYLPECGPCGASGATAFFKRFSEAF